MGIDSSMSNDIEQRHETSYRISSSSQPRISWPREERDRINSLWKAQCTSRPKAASEPEVT